MQLALLVLAAAAAPTLQVGDLKLTPIAQLRVRGEAVPDRSLNGGSASGIIQHRARVGAKAAVGDVDIVISLQDVRAWGFERSPPGAIPPDPTVTGVIEGSLGLFEAYAALHLADVEVRVGRQAVALGNERLIGAGDFGMQGRAFDAARLIVDGADVDWTVFGAVVADADGPAGDGVAADDDIFLGAAYVEMKLQPWLRVAPSFIYDSAPIPGRQRLTYGARFDGKSGNFEFDVDAYGQTARVGDAGFLNAALVGARGAWSWEMPLHPRIGGVVDAVSGSPAPGGGAGGRDGFAPFSVLHGTNHKFYGLGDVIENVPVHTEGKGLVDAAAVGWLHEGPWSATVQLHAFLPFAYEGPGPYLYGVEPDIVGTFKPNAHLAFEAGCALFVPTGPALGRGDHAAAWAYLQMQAWL